MADSIVDFFKVIQVDIHQGKRHILICQQTDQKIHAGGYFDTIRKSRQCIKVVHLIEPLFVFLHCTVVLGKKRILPLGLFLACLDFNIGFFQICCLLLGFFYLLRDTSVIGHNDRNDKKTQCRGR